MFLLFVVVIIFLIRIWWVVKWAPPATLESMHSTRRLRVCVVLGSGGHTAEMIGVLSSLPQGAWEKHTEPVYIVSDTDRDSENVAQQFETGFQRRARCVRIPRAREVGQSYCSSIFSTLRATAVSLAVVWRESPEVILTNGPGVCIPIVIANIVLAALTVQSRASTSYFESFTCVDHLSLSGRLMLPVCDIFTVQWKDLMETLRKTYYFGLVAKNRSSLWFTGPEMQTDTPPLLSTEQDPPLSRSPIAVVTVGSTCFDKLMHHVDTLAFLKALRRLGITECIVQKGRSSYVFHSLSDAFTTDAAGVQVTIVDYKPFLNLDIQRASLVVSHAGAGTILEALAARTPLIVVPNPMLMANHQLVLAQRLAERGYLHLLSLPTDESTTHDDSDILGDSDVSKLRQFPPPNKLMIAEAFRRIFRRSL